VFAGVSAGACGLLDLVRLPVQSPVSLSPRPYSLGLLGVKTLKSASTEISLVTNQQVTRGLFKRLDEVIAYAGEITNPRLRFCTDQVALQLLRARYA
jgi:hypothetical protein